MPKGHDVKVKKSLNFNEDTNHDSRSSSSMSGRNSATGDVGRKRLQDEVFGSLSDDEELCGKSKNYTYKCKAL